MPAQKKIEEVQRLEELLSSSPGALGVNYRGLTVQQGEALRRVVRAAGGTYRVVKNNLVSIAATNVGKEHFGQVLDGPTAVVFFKTDDLVVPIKAVTEHLRSTRSVATVNGAIFNGQFLTATEVERVASLPSRQVLQAQVLGLLQAPAQQLVNVLTGHLRGLVTVLQRRREQLEESQGGR